MTEPSKSGGYYVREAEMRFPHQKHIRVEALALATDTGKRNPKYARLRTRTR